MSGISNQLPPAIFLMGPTAAGKTDLAVRLVQEKNCEIISVDSALVYRDMNIGTAKPDAELLAKAPHRLIDIRDPSEPYSAMEFRADALQAMAEITAAGKVPLLTGGTMMYFKFLRDGAAKLPPADEVVRQKLDQQAAEHGWQFMHDRLREVDPVSADRIHPNDPQRLQRALEVYEITGKSMTEFWKEQQMDGGPEPLPYNVVNLAVCPEDRKILHERIALRYETMLKQGFVNEVKALYERGDLDVNLPSIRAVGYRQVWDYLDGNVGYDEMVEKGIIATRQLAKRQITWLRSWPELNWFESQDENLFENVLKKLNTASIFV